MKSIPSGKRLRWPYNSQAMRFSMYKDEHVQKMMRHCRQLDIIRNDPDFRLTFLFQGSAQLFISEFRQSKGRMQDFLSDLEECARQLDNLKFRVNISSVAGSSLSIVGGILSIVGMALIPVTAGVSSVLTVAGISCGVTSGVNSLVTGVAEMTVSKKHRDRSETTFQCFMKDVQTLVVCMEKVASSACPANRSEQIRALINNKGDNTVKIGQAGANLYRIGNRIENVLDSGGVAKGTSLMSKAARSGFIALNALFIGLDVLFICKDSISLSKGSKNEMAQLIRSRAALWRSELDSWEKIHDSLCRGLREFSSSQEILEQPFYPK
ncbi:apolipoprotein L4-like isoform X2 [Engraulis encrasicolus]